MGRCIYCHSVITRHEDYCYMCGDRVVKQKRSTVKSRPLSAWTNTIFLASLAFTVYRFFGEHKLSLPITLAISASLLLVRILAERLIDKNPD